jgi:hypothetical protein
MLDPAVRSAAKSTGGAGDQVLWRRTGVDFHLKRPVTQNNHGRPTCYEGYPDVATQLLAFRWKAVKPKHQLNAYMRLTAAEEYGDAGADEWHE